MLLNSINDVKNVIQVSAAATFDRLKPHLANAESTYIQPLLGAEMYAAILEYQADDETYKITEPGFSTSTPPEDVDEDEYPYAIVLWYAQHAIVNLAYHLGFDSLNAYIADQGFGRLESDRVKSLFKYQEDNLKRYFRETGMNSLDTMLEILELNIEKLPEFATELQKLKGKIIPDTKTFNAHYHIGNSRIVFLRLQTHIKTVEELQIVSAVGADVINTVYTELAKETPAQSVVKLLPYLRDPLVHFAVAMLMEDTGAEITERGLYFKGVKNIVNSDLIMPAAEPRVLELIARTKSIANQYMQRLNRYLTENWIGYDNPRYRAHNRDNTDKKTFWA